MFLFSLDHFFLAINLRFCVIADERISQNAPLNASAHAHYRMLPCPYYLSDFHVVLGPQKDALLRKFFEPKDNR